MTTDRDVLEYDAQERWLVMTQPNGASAILARDVDPWAADVLINLAVEADPSAAEWRDAYFALARIAQEQLDECRAALERTTP